MGSATTPKLQGEIEAGSAASDAWQGLLRSNARLLRELDEELRHAHGYTIGDYDVLIHLAAAPEGRRRMCELADAVLLSPSGISRRVERLERAGLVRRERALGDARNIEAGLTDDGRRQLRKLRRTHRGGIRERFASKFNDRELETLAKLLGRLVEPDDGDGATC